MNRIALALALARGDLSPEKGAELLAKSRAAEPEDEDLVKAGGHKYLSRKPKPGGGYTYVYADKPNAHGHGHVGSIAGAPNGDFNYKPGDPMMHTGTDKVTPVEFHEDHGDGTVTVQADGKPVKTTYQRLRTPRSGEHPGAGDAKPAGGAKPKGKHVISVPGGGKKEVDTVAQHGLYAVHHDPTSQSPRRHVVTHLPSGMVAAGARTKGEAVAIARHFHAHAGDAGADAKLGEQPSRAAMRRLTAARHDLLEGNMRKSWEEWTPTNAPTDAQLSLQKGFTDLATGDRMGVAEDAFHAVPRRQLRKGGGDTALQGIGAGFDPRWNGGVGVGQTE